MYICICNALKERDLKKACQNTCSIDGEAVLREAGCQAQCGQCLEYIESCLLPLNTSSSPKDTSREPSSLS